MPLQPDQNNYSITGLIIAGFILILLLTVMNSALVSFGEQFDFDPDDLFMELGTINSILTLFFFATMVLGFELGVFAAILRLECLTGHIGEKRPADSMAKFIKFLPPRFVTTALFDSAVVLILFIPRKILISGGVLLCVRSFHPVASKKIS